MRKINLILIYVLVTSVILTVPACAGTMIISSTAAYDSSEAMIQNLDRAIALLDGRVLQKGQAFSFNEAVGPRSAENGFTPAPNGNGVTVMGGGTAQIATTLHMAVTELGETVQFDELHHFGTAFNAGYAAQPSEAILTDYSRNLDYRFTSSHPENLTISMWRAGSNIFCQLTGGEATPEATREPAASIAPENTQLPESTSQPVEKTLYIVNVNSYVNLRSEPSTSSESLARITCNESVEYAGETSGDFTKVVYDGKTGYVHSDYLSGINPNRTVLTVVNCRECVTLREKPSRQANRIADVYLGESVVYLEDAENGFYKVEHKGLEGYVLASYLTEP